MVVEEREEIQMSEYDELRMREVEDGYEERCPICNMRMDDPEHEAIMRQTLTWMDEDTEDNNWGDDDADD